MKEINYIIELGVINTLRVDRLTEPGIYLMSESGEDVLLPNQYVTDAMAIDSHLDVFIYTDSDDRLVATTLTPKAMLDEFGLFEVVDVTHFGAFVDWGLPKDLLVPKNRQKKPFKVGEKRFLRVVKDTQSDRLIGVEKIGQFLKEPPRSLSRTNSYNGLVIAKTQLGFKLIIDNQYEGMIYHDEVFEAVEVGDHKKVYVKNVRKDKLLDLTLRKPGAKTATDADKILALLEANNGILPYNYKSDAEVVKNIFAMSKKMYKRTLTELIEAKKIEVNETGMYKV